MGGITWRDLGTEKSGGTKLWSISGHVKKPGVYELPMGYADMEKFIMEDCGGMLREIRNSRRSFPGGSSVYIMNAGQILGKNVTLDYEGLVAAGSMLGTGGMMVMDETVDIMETTKNLTEFYKHESCGWCTPCREGTDWLVKIFNRISIGRRKARGCAVDARYLRQHRGQIVLSAWRRRGVADTKRDQAVSGRFQEVAAHEDGHLREQCLEVGQAVSLSSAD